MKKIGAFFKKIGTTIKEAFVETWALIKEIPWSQPVKPLVAWCIVGGALAIALAIILIFLL